MWPWHRATQLLQGRAHDGSGPSSGRDKHKSRGLVTQQGIELHIHKLKYWHVYKLQLIEMSRLIEAFLCNK